jgi:hypothetical protein
VDLLSNALLQIKQYILRKTGLYPLYYRDERFPKFVELLSLGYKDEAGYLFRRRKCKVTHCSKEYIYSKTCIFPKKYQWWLMPHFTELYLLSFKLGDVFPEDLLLTLAGYLFNCEK